MPMGKNKMKSKLKEIKLIVQMYELIMKPVHMCANKLKAFSRRFAKTSPNVTAQAVVHR